MEALARHPSKVRHYWPLNHGAIWGLLTGGQPPFRGKSIIAVTFHPRGSARSFRVNYRSRPCNKPPGVGSVRPVRTMRGQAH